MASLFYVHLKQIAEIVQRGTSLSQTPLLLYRRRFRISLGNNDAPQSITKLTRYFLISRFSTVITEADLRIWVGRFEKNSPTIFGHFHIVEVGPTVGFNTDCGAQVNILVLKTFRSHLLPPFKVIRQPLFQRAQKFLVLGKIYIIRYAFVQFHI